MAYGKICGKLAVILVGQFANFNVHTNGEIQNGILP